MHRLLPQLVVSLAAGLILAIPIHEAAAQSTVYVRAAAVGGDGLSWATAYGDLQDAFALAHAPNSPVEQIWVAEGVYRPAGGSMDRTASFVMRGGLRVFGGFAGTESSLAERNWRLHRTVLSGDLAGDDEPDFGFRSDNSFHVVVANLVGASATLDGFIVEGGAADGSGVAGEGGGLRAERSDLVISNCTFRSNLAIRGGAVFSLLGDPTFVNCVFTTNLGIKEVGAVHCTVDAWVSIAPVVLHCTFVNNRAGKGGLATALSCTSIGGGMVLRNSIFLGNRWVGDFNTYPEQFWGLIDSAYVCTPQFAWPPAGPGSTDADPLFVDPDGPDDIWGNDDDDLRLLPGSPCIDAGQNAAVPLDWFDLDADGDTAEPVPFDGFGGPRRFDDPGAADVGDGFSPLADMGAHEGPVLAGVASPAAVTIMEGTDKLIKVRLTRPPPAPVIMSLAVTGDPDVVASPPTLSFDQSDWGEWRDVTLTSLQDADTLDTTPALVLSGAGLLDTIVPILALDDDIAEGTLFVNAAANGGNTGLSWDDAFPDLQVALAEAAESEGAVTQIWVAKGLYRPDGGTKNRATPFDLLNGLAIYGGFAGGEVSLGQRDWGANPTILSGDLKQNDGPNWETREDNSFHIVRSVGNDASAVLDGFVVTGGYANLGEGGDQSQGAGAYIFNGTPTLRNCAFVDNHAGGNGGGVYSFAAGTTVVEGCRFEGNTSGGEGGGMYVAGLWGFASPVVDACDFAGNIAAGRGGGAIVYGNLLASGTTFTGNSTVKYQSRGGGLYLYNGAENLEGDNLSLLEACVFSGNTAAGDQAFGGGAELDGIGTAVLHGCEFYDNSATRDGGGVNCSSNSLTVKLTDCWFSGNHADFIGGGAHLTVKVTVSGCSFVGNTASSTGGLRMGGKVVGCTFANNSSLGFGGGLYLTGGSAHACGFLDNAAGAGGGPTRRQARSRTATSAATAPPEPRRRAAACPGRARRSPWSAAHSPVTRRRGPAAASRLSKPVS